MIYDLQKHCDVQYCISYFFYGAVVLSSYKYFISALRCLEMVSTNAESLWPLPSPDLHVFHRSFLSLGPLVPAAKSLPMHIRNMSYSPSWRKIGYAVVCFSLVFACGLDVKLFLVKAFLDSGGRITAWSFYSTGCPFKGNFFSLV